MRSINRWIDQSRLHVRDFVVICRFKRASQKTTEFSQALDGIILLANAPVLPLQRAHQRAVLCVSLRHVGGNFCSSHQLETSPTPEHAPVTEGFSLSPPQLLDPPRLIPLTLLAGSDRGGTRPSWCGTSCVMRGGDPEVSGSAAQHNTTRRGTTRRGAAQPLLLVAAALANEAGEEKPTQWIWTLKLRPGALKIQLNWIYWRVSLCWHEKPAHSLTQPFEL